MTATPLFQVRQLAQDPADWAAARAHLHAYRAELGVDLSFQGFAEELADLPRAYPPPGGVWLALTADSVVGSVALRPLGSRLAELKRLFVLPSARGCGVGRALVEAALRAARAAAFHAVRLDTLSGMTEAQGLYRALGFRPISPYGPESLSGTQYFELALVETAAKGASRG